MGRAPTVPNICGRSTTSLTGRPACCAAIAASTTCDHTEPLQPKPPPTNGQTTRTFSAGMPSVPDTALRTPVMYWVESYSVSSSPSQLAIVACGSIGLWFSIGVV
ncbi:hypothetical protein D3C72_2042510 [compost metagenome]